MRRSGTDCAVSAFRDAHAITDSDGPADRRTDAYADARAHADADPHSGRDRSDAEFDELYGDGRRERTKR